MSAGCVILPNGTIYSTPISTAWPEGIASIFVTVPATTSTVVATSTFCYAQIGRRGRDLDPRQLDCPYGTYYVPYTTVTTYPSYVTEVFQHSLIPVTITESPVPIQTLYITSCTSLWSNSSSSSSTSTTSSSSSTSSSSTSTSTSTLTSTNSSTITSTSSSTSTTSSLSTFTSFNSTSISSANSTSTTSVRTSISSASPPSSSSSSSGTTSPPLTRTHTSLTSISTRTPPSASLHSSLPSETQTHSPSRTQTRTQPTQTHSPSRSQTKTRLTLTHSPSRSQPSIILTTSLDSSSRPITLTISPSAPISIISPISSPFLPISSHASLGATSAPSQASRTRVSEISQASRTQPSAEATKTRPVTGTINQASASGSGATSDGSQTLQPFIFTGSLAFDSQANSAQTPRTRPQTRTVQQATATNQAHTAAVNTIPASAQHTPNATPNQTQQQASADRVTPNNRPTGQSNANTPQATQGVTNNNTPQQTAPATNAVTPQLSNSLLQATTVQASTPGATTAVLPQASTTGGVIGPNSQATVDHHPKPNIGAIVGGTLGALALLVLLGTAAVKYLKGQSGNGAGGRGREEDVAVTQSLMGDFVQGGMFAGGAAGVSGQGAGSGKGGPGNKAGPAEGGSGAQGGEGSYDPEMTQVLNNHAPPPANGSEQPGPSSQFPQQPQAGPYGHPAGGYGAGTGGAEGVAHGHGAGGGGHGNVAPHAGGGGGSYGNVAPGAGGGGGGGGGGGHAVGPANGGGGAGNAGTGGGGEAGAGGNAPPGPPGSGSGTGPVGTDVSNPGPYFDPTHGTIPPGSDIPPGAAGGHHGPGFIPVIVPLGARRRPAARTSQSSMVNTLPTPYYVTGATTYDEGYPAGAVSSTSLVGGNTSGNERPSTDGGVSRRYSLSDGLYGGPTYGRYEDPFEEGHGLLPSYEAGPGPAAAARRRNEKDYR